MSGIARPTRRYTLLLPALVIILLLVTLLPVAVAAEGAARGAREPIRVREANGLKVISNGVITVVFPAEKTMPRFIWYLEGGDGPLYLVDYHALVEYAVVNTTYFTRLQHRFREYYDEWISKVIKGLEKELNKTLVVIQDLNETVSEVDVLSQVVDGILNDTISKEEAVERLEEALERLERVKDRVKDEEIADAVSTIVDMGRDLRRALGMGTGPAFEHVVRHAASSLRGVLRAYKVLMNGVRTRVRLMKFKADMIRERIRVAEQVRYRLREGLTHPPVLPFPALTWELGDVYNITDDQGNVIGLGFTMRVVDAPKAFEFAKGRVELRFRVYTVSVEEEVSVNNTTLIYNVTRAEMKTDVVIKGWEWLLEELPDLNLLNEGLALCVKLARINATPVEIAPDMLKGDLQKILERAQADVKVRVTGAGAAVRTRLGFNASIERPIEFVVPGISIGPARLPQVKIVIGEENETVIGGFFRFVPVATVVNPSTGEEWTVNVTASYAETLNHVTLFICYPYFNNYTLIHDPSIGLEVAEAYEAPSSTVTLSTETTTPGATPEATPTMTPTTATSPAEAEAQGLPVTTLALIGVGLAVLLVVIVVIVRKR